MHLPSKFPKRFPRGWRIRSCPVPVTPAMAVLGRTSVFTTNVLSMIDGERSIVEMARQMGRSWNVDPGPLQDQLRVFFAQLPTG